MLSAMMSYGSSSIGMNREMTQNEPFRKRSYEVDVLQRLLISILELVLLDDLHNTDFESCYLGF